MAAVRREWRLASTVDRRSVTDRPCLVVITGATYDKRMLQRLTRDLGRDRDINCLLRSVLFLRPVRLVITAALAVATLVWSLCTSLKDFSAFLPLSFLLILPLLHSVREQAELIRKASNDVLSAWQYLRFVLSKRHPRQPMDLWMLYQVGASDAQVALAAQKMGYETSCIFCGEPYYDVRVVDYVELTFLSHGNIAAKVFRELLNSFPLQVMAAWMLGPHDYTSRSLYLSSYTYGALFGSTFFTQLLRAVDERWRLSGSSSRASMEFILPDLPYAHRDLAFAVEALKLITHPAPVSFLVCPRLSGSDTACETVSVCPGSRPTDERVVRMFVSDVRFLGEGSESGVRNASTRDGLLSKQRTSASDTARMTRCGVKTRFAQRKENENDSLADCGRVRLVRLRIPLKKPVALPKGRSGRLLDAPFPEAAMGGGPLTVLFLGGCEHNLALLHAITWLRWNYPNIQYGVGIAENMFDRLYQSGYLLGSEITVYGIAKEVFTRDDHGHRAEVLHLPTGPIGRRDLVPIPGHNVSLDDCRIYAVVGYSAPSTKICALRFLYAMLNDETEFLPDGSRPSRITYAAPVGDAKFLTSDFLREWDGIDGINKLDRAKQLVKQVTVDQG